MVANPETRLILTAHHSPYAPWTALPVSAVQPISSHISLRLIFLPYCVVLRAKGWRISRRELCQKVSNADRDWRLGRWDSITEMSPFSPSMLVLGMHLCFSAAIFLSARVFLGPLAI